MLSLFRCAPKILLLKSNNEDKLGQYFTNKLKCLKCTVTSAYDKVDGNGTIIYIVDEIDRIIKCSDPKSVFIINMNTDKLLANIINDKKHNLISKIRISPVMILMRAFGNIDNIINKISEKHECTIEPTKCIWEKYDSGTIVSFTQTPLNKIISFSDLHNKSIHLDENHTDLLNEFRIKGLEYLNASINNKDWYELEIKIYDCHGQYELHYERLLTILEHLEIGLILGESWGKDAAKLFLYVDVYRVRLFTFYQPEYIKKVLLALEHRYDGTRLIDYDLFFKRKKIHWSNVKDGKLKSREQLSKKYRKELFAKLKESDVEKINKMEKYILDSRESETCPIKNN